MKKIKPLFNGRKKLEVKIVPTEMGPKFEFSQGDDLIYVHTNRLDEIKDKRKYLHMYRAIVKQLPEVFI